MPILESDLIHRYSGAGTTSDPDSSIGGAINLDPAGVIVSDTDNNDMGDITSTEAADGVVIYRGFFYRNEITSSVLTWTNPVFWIQSQTSSGDTDIDIGIAPELKNLAIEILSDELTAPAGVSFTAPATKATGIAILDLEQDEFRGHWLQYSVNAGASSTTDTYTIRAEGDTLP